MTIRLDQIASVLQRAVQSSIQRGLHDPRIRGLISITGVKLSPDLAEATISISVHPEKHADLTLHGLQHAARRIRSDVSRRVDLRRVPRLRFRLDDSIKKQGRLEAALREEPEEPDGDNAANASEESGP